MNDMEAYGDGYMEPEEEWEREGLLDPAWEKQQKKVSDPRYFLRATSSFKKSVHNCAADGVCASLLFVDRSGSRFLYFFSISRTKV
jgi:hypothetical protein